MYDEFRKVVLFGDLETAKSMLSADPTLVKLTDKYEFTVLHELVGEERPDMTRLLVEHGADPDAANDEGIRPMHLAVPKQVVVLKWAGADVNARAKGGRTPLHVQAAEAEGYESMLALLNAGADPSLVDDEGKTAADIASQRGEHDKIRLLAMFKPQ